MGKDHLHTKGLIDEPKEGSRLSAEDLDGRRPFDHTPNHLLCPPNDPGPEAPTDWSGPREESQEIIYSFSVYLTTYATGQYSRYTRIHFGPN